jgi:hypothetical protein
VNFSDQSRQEIYRFFWRLSKIVLGSVKYQPWGALKHNNMSKFGTGYTKMQQKTPGVDCVAFPSMGGIYQPTPSLGPAMIAFLQRYFADPDIVAMSDPTQYRLSIIHMPQNKQPPSASIEIRFVTDHWGPDSQFLISLSPTGILSLNAAPNLND